jgi:hypothetical protein
LRQLKVDHEPWTEATYCMLLSLLHGFAVYCVQIF